MPLATIVNKKGRPSRERGCCVFGSVMMFVLTTLHDENDSSSLPWVGWIVGVVAVMLGIACSVTTLRVSMNNVQYSHRMGQGMQKPKRVGNG